MLTTFADQEDDYKGHSTLFTLRVMEKALMNLKDRKVIKEDDFMLNLINRSLDDMKFAIEHLERKNNQDEEK